MSVVARSAGHIRVGHGIGRVDVGNTVTPLELEVLALYASGYSYKEIGDLKFISPLTVRNRLYHALDRSGARNVMHLAAIAVEQHLIRLGPSGLFEPDQDLRIAGE